MPSRPRGALQGRGAALRRVRGGRRASVAWRHSSWRAPQRGIDWPGRVCLSSSRQQGQAKAIAATGNRLAWAGVPEQQQVHKRDAATGNRLAWAGVPEQQQAAGA